MLEKMFAKIVEKNYSEEELAQLAAMILNETTMPISCFTAFWTTLDENIQAELESRIEDLGK